MAKQNTLLLAVAITTLDSADHREDWDMTAFWIVRRLACKRTQTWKPF